MYFCIAAFAVAWDTGTGCMLPSWPAGTLKLVQPPPRRRHEAPPAGICRRVAHVKPGAVGGVEHAVIICEEGLDVGKAVEDSDSVVLRLSSADEVQLCSRPSPCWTTTELSSMPSKASSSQDAPASSELAASVEVCTTQQQCLCHLVKGCTIQCGRLWVLP